MLKISGLNSALVEYSPEQCHYVICAFMELLDIFIPSWCTQLAHCADNKRGESLDVYSIIVGLLMDQLNIQHLHDLRPHTIGPRIEE